MVKPLRVLIVDDSALIRRSLTHVLNSDSQIEVVGTASDGFIALEKIQELDPDVVILDIHMPRMDGLQTLGYMMRRHPLPVVMFSSITTAQAEVTLQALRLGAVDFVTKPTRNLSDNLRFLTSELVGKVKAAQKARLQPIRNHRDLLKVETIPEKNAVPKSPQSESLPVSDDTALIVIGCSTGGPAALEKIIPSLPNDFPGAIGIVQHMPEPFSRIFAKNLGQISAVKVKVAENGEPFRTGQVLMAPGDADLRVVRQGGQVVANLDRPREDRLGWMSSIDLFFCSAARAMKNKTLGILLTGMGRDGAKGMAAIKIVGGTTIAEDESSAVVFGMPKAAIESGAVDSVVPLWEISTLILEKQVKRKC
jgi:two-component system chemotaxis response regulator CheB